MSGHKVLLESDQIIGLFPQVKLFVHHTAKHFHFFRKRNPLHARKESQDVSEERHDGEVALYKLGYSGVQDFDCDRGSGDRRLGFWDDDRREGSWSLFTRPLRVEV